jgi:hypothetical protein
MVKAIFFGGNSLIADAVGAVSVVAVATVVAVTDVVVDVVDVDVVVEDVDDEPDDDATGVPLTAFDAAESPTALTALMVTE